MRPKLFLKLAEIGLNEASTVEGSERGETCCTADEEG